MTASTSDLKRVGKLLEERLGTLDEPLLAQLGDEALRDLVAPVSPTASPMPSRATMTTSAEAVRRFRPGPHFGPEPHVDATELGYGLREVGVPATPVVHYLRALDVEARGDLDCVDEEFEINLPTHDRNVRRRVSHEVVRIR